MRNRMLVLIVVVSAGETRTVVFEYPEIEK